MNGKTARSLALLGLVELAACDGPTAEKAPAPAGITEASAVVLLHGDRVAVVAGDEKEDGVWAIEPGAPAHFWSLEIPKGTGKLDDLEALGAGGQPGEFFALTSQSRSRNGDTKEKRNRIARLRVSPDGRSLEGVNVCSGLRESLIPALAGGLGDALRDPAALERRPQEGGLNVEGLARYGSRLMLGLRDTETCSGAGSERVCRNFAVLVPLLNPDEYLERCADGVAPSFGPPVVLPVGEMGVRDLAESPNGIIVLLGATTDSDDERFRLLEWLPAEGRLFYLRILDAQGITRPEGIARAADGRLLLVQDFEQLEPTAILWVQTERGAEMVAPRLD
jgi:hypothetical protein